LIFQEALAIHVEEIRQQRQTAACRQQREQLRRRRLQLQALDDLLHDDALVGCRDNRVRQYALEIWMTPHEIVERRELLPGDFRIRFLDGDVEQRSRISRRRGSHAHGVYGL
jgi:hypothetical protein